MKAFVYGSMVVALMLIVSGCATTPPRYMAFNATAPRDLGAVKPESGKAALVVARTTVFGGAIEFSTYLDRKMIGVTQWKSYFVKPDVTPGPHYVISQAENEEPIKINFEPNCVYYLQQIPRMGVWRARISVAPVTLKELLTSFDDSCRLVVYDTTKPGDDLPEKTYNSAVHDYEREVKEGLHKEDAAYKGAPAKP